MRAWLATFGVVAQIAFRNLFASRLKTIIVGGIILFGGLLVVAGNSLLDSVVAAMSRSVIGSVAGHIQVYNAKSKDPLEVMGRMMMGDPDLAQLDDFSRVRESLLKVPNVKTVVPMGISGALVTSGNTIDLALEKLRNAVKRRRDAHDGRRSRGRRSPGRRREGPRSPDRRGPADGSEERQHDARRARHRQGRRGGRCARRVRPVLGGVRQGTVRVARIPREPYRQPGRRRRPPVPQLRRDRLPGVPEVIRPDEDRRGHDGAARQARLPVREARLRGAAQAQGGAAPRPDQGRRRFAGRDHREDARSGRGWCARTSRRCARSSPARRGEDDGLPRQAAARARQQGAGRRQAAGRASSRPTTRTSTSATTSSTASWRRRWSCTGCASATC